MMNTFSENVVRLTQCIYCSLVLKRQPPLPPPPPPPGQSKPISLSVGKFAQLLCSDSVGPPLLHPSVPAPALCTVSTMGVAKLLLLLLMGMVLSVQGIKIVEQSEKRLVKKGEKVVLFCR